MSLRIRLASRKNWLLIFAIAFLCAMSSGQSANADGCWGSSRGGWGSGGSMGGGSYGSRGGLFSNAPVRNLISRVGVGVGNGISLLGDGISNIFERRPLRSAMFGSSGGWGSQGGGSYGYASTGSGWGQSTGGSWGSCGGSTWTQPTYAVPVQAPLCETIAPVATIPVATDCYSCGTVVPAFSNGTTYMSTSGQFSPTISQFETGAPILDYGYMGSQSGVIGAPTDASIVNGSMVTGPMMDLQTAPGSGTVEDPYYGGAEEDDGIGAEEPPIGGDTDDDTTFMSRGKAILTLDVPAEAKVFINDKLTTTEGTRRSYASRNLDHGQEYRYRVKVVTQVEGQEVVKSRVIKMRGGETNLVAFNFDPVITRVVVSVPKDAKVKIDGKETSAEGSYRSFSTEKLKSGIWDDYSVEVSVVRDGKTLTRTETFDLAAGEFRFFEFDFDQTNSGSLANK